MSGCCPDKVNQKAYRDVSNLLEHSEKCHINLITCESRKQSEIIYALHRLNQYISQ